MIKEAQETALIISAISAAVIIFFMVKITQIATDVREIKNALLDKQPSATENKSNSEG
jgi:hypothetical protein